MSPIAISIFRFQSSSKKTLWVKAVPLWDPFATLRLERDLLIISFCFAGITTCEPFPLVTIRLVSINRLWNTILVYWTENIRGFLCSSFSGRTMERQVDPESHVLESLKIDRFEGRTGFFEDWKRVGLVIAGQGNAVPLAGYLSVFQKVVDELATLFTVADSGEFPSCGSYTADVWIN